MCQDDDNDRRWPYVNAYDPNPLPVKNAVKNGEREQTGRAALLITSHRNAQ